MMKFCLIRDAATYSWKRNGAAGTLRHKILVMLTLGSNGLFLSYTFCFVSQISDNGMCFTITIRTMNLAETFVYKASVSGMNTRWGGLCEFLPPSQSYPSCSKWEDVALPEKSPAWYTEGGLRLTFLLRSVPCLSTKMLVTAQSCQRLPLGGVWRFTILLSGLMVP